MLNEVDQTRGHHLLVAEVAGELVGTVAVVVVPSVIGQPYAFVETLFVIEASRRHGVARRLMETAIQTARTAGCFGVNLLSGHRNREAHALFESLGFEGRSKGYILYFR